MAPSVFSLFVLSIGYRRVENGGRKELRRRQACLLCVYVFPPPSPFLLLFEDVFPPPSPFLLLFEAFADARYCRCLSVEASNSGYHTKNVTALLALLGEEKCFNVLGC